MQTCLCNRCEGRLYYTMSLMKLFRRDQDKENVEKPIVIHYAKYTGVLSSNKSYPLEEGAYVKFYEDRVVVDLLKSKHQTVVPYKNMTEVQNVDAGKKVDLDRIVGLGLASGGIGSIVGILWKRHAVYFVNCLPIRLYGLLCHNAILIG
jgi:hypothetical protein